MLPYLLHDLKYKQNGLFISNSDLFLYISENNKYGSSTFSAGLLYKCHIRIS